MDNCFDKRNEAQPDLLRPAPLSPGSSGPNAALENELDDTFFVKKVDVPRVESTANCEDRSPRSRLANRAVVGACALGTIPVFVEIGSKVASADSSMRGVWLIVGAGSAIGAALISYAALRSGKIDGNK